MLQSMVVCFTWMSCKASKEGDCIANAPVDEDVGIYEFAQNLTMEKSNFLL